MSNLGFDRKNIPHYLKNICLANLYIYSYFYFIIYTQ